MPATRGERDQAEALDQSHRTFRPRPSAPALEAVPLRAVRRSEKIAAILCRPCERGEAAHVEFDFSGQFDDGFGMVAVLEQRVFDGLRTADEQPPWTALFLGDPLAAPVPADENDG